MRRAINVAVVLAILAVAVIGCDVDGTEVPDPVVGTWNGVLVTSEGVHTPLSDSGETFVVTVDADKTYTVVRTSYSSPTDMYYGTWSRDHGSYSFISPIRSTAIVMVDGNVMNFHIGTVVYQLDRL